MEINLHAENLREDQDMKIAYRKMDLEQLLFPTRSLLLPYDPKDMEQPYHSCSHFPHDFWSSYEDLIHYQCEDSCAHLNGCYVRLLNLERLSYFEHVVHTYPRATTNRCAIKIRNQIRHIKIACV